MPRIYLDHHSTTPLDPRVFEAMKPCMLERFGNAASAHEFGQEAREDVEIAREQVAALIGCDPAEIVFTSGATESDNLAIKGMACDRIVTVATEHPAVLDSCPGALRLKVGADGLINLNDLRSEVRERTLVTVMFANNEIGVLQDIPAIGALCKERAAIFHTDAAQAAGKVPIDVRAMDIHLLSLSAHKMYGPKGVGALYVRKRNPRVKLKPLIDGGGHESGLRSGTLNVPGIVGFGVACEIAGHEMRGEAKRLKELRDRLWNGLKTIDHVTLNGHPKKRLPGNLNVSFKYVESESLIEELEGIAVSSGAACTTAKAEPSHVLRAIGLPEDLARGSIRFGLGRFTTESEIDETISRVVAAVAKVRKKSPLYRQT